MRSGLRLHLCGWLTIYVSLSIGKVIRRRLQGTMGHIWSVAARACHVVFWHLLLSETPWLGSRKESWILHWVIKGHWTNRLFHGCPPWKRGLRIFKNEAPNVWLDDLSYLFSPRLWKFTSFPEKQFDDYRQTNYIIMNRNICLAFTTFKILIKENIFILRTMILWLVFGLEARSPEFYI